MKPIVSDTILRDTVIKELDDDPEVAAKHISVTAIDGAITLAGHVMTIHEKHVAVRAAERIRAVRAIADDIEVREPSLHERADDEIAEEIAHLRSWGAEIPDSVAAQVRGGRVILHGNGISTRRRRERSPSAHGRACSRQPDQGQGPHQADRRGRRASRARGDRTNSRSRRPIDADEDKGARHDD